jgi:integrase
MRYLTVAESKRLIAAAAPDFRRLVQAALATGCRYSELCRMTVADFDPDSKTVAIHITKSGKARRVVLTDEANALFVQWCAGRAGGDVLLLRADGTPWRISHQEGPMRKACDNARITPPAGFHVLRHTHGSLLAMRGVPMAVIAQQLGHASVKVTEKHYAHLAPSYVADAIRKGAPVFGFKADKRVAPLR